MRQRSRTRVEQTLGPDAFAEAWAQGEAMSIDEAAARAAAVNEGRQHALESAAHVALDALSTVARN